MFGYFKRQNRHFYGRVMPLRRHVMRPLHPTLAYLIQHFYIYTARIKSLFIKVSAVNGTMNDKLESQNRLGHSAECFSGRRDLQARTDLPVNRSRRECTKASGIKVIERG